MKRRSILYLLLASLICPQIYPAAAPSQSPEPKERQTKDFGSSLERLKWDEKKKQLVEVKDPKQVKAESIEDEVIRVETTMAVLDLLVADKRGRAITGLTKEDFIVSEDEKPQAVESFSLGDGQTLPRSIVLIIDWSGSQLPFLNNSLDAASVLVDQLARHDKMAIVTDDVLLMVDFTSDKKKLKEGLESLRKRASSGGRLGRSAQYSALYAVLRELVNKEERPIIIFQTDGDELSLLRPIDNSTSPATRSALRPYSFIDICHAAERSRTTIYTIIPGLKLIGATGGEQLERAKLIQQKRIMAMSERMPSGQNFPQMRIGDLADDYYMRIASGLLRQQLAAAGVAQLTGGWAEFLEEPEMARAIYTRILLGINRRYIIGYYPTNSERDGKLRRVKIAVRNHPEYIVWGRKSYYAAEPDHK